MLIKLLSCLFLCLSFSINDALSQSNDQMNKKIIINSNPPGAIVYIEGSMVGITPCSLSFDLTGKYHVRAFKKGYENWNRTIFFGQSPTLQINISLSTKTALKAGLRSFVLPGWGQTYSDKKTKGTIIKILQAGAVISTLFYEYKYQNAIIKYNDALENYDKYKFFYEQRNKYFTIVEEKYDIVKKSYKERNTFLIISGTIWLYSVLDAIFAFPTHYEQILSKNSINLSCRFSQYNSQILISKSFVLN